MKINFLAQLMYSAVYYPAGCDTVVPEHYCNDCDELEHGRVRSVALVRRTAIPADLSAAAGWEAAVAAGDAIVIPEVLGSFNGGEPVEGTGYGDQASKLTGYNFELTYKDPNYAQNADFYNAIKRARDFVLVYRTETKVHSSEASVQVIPKNPVTENLTDEVVWDVTVKWSHGDLPTPVDMPDGIFECFAYVAP